MNRTEKRQSLRYVGTITCAIVLASVFGWAAPVRSVAQELNLLGPNSDFPDSNLVMPFVATEGRVGFFAISNIGVSGGSVEDPQPVGVTWSFYGESGELLVEVQRYVLGEGGTDIVDVSAVRSRDASGSEGPATSLVGHNGFAVASKDDREPDLIGFWTVANVDANAGYGGNAAGLGFVGLLPTSSSLLTGTSFSPASLGDNLLMILGVDDFEDVPTSLTGGSAPQPGQTVFSVAVSLYANEAPEGLLARVDLPVEGTAVFSSLQDLFAGYDLTTAVTIVVEPLTAGVSVLGFYGQAVGQFGAGQALRTDFLLSE